MKVKSYCDLVVWQKAMDFVEEVYRITKEFPKSELYGLTNQLRRSPLSVSSNIAGVKAAAAATFCDFWRSPKDRLAKPRLRWRSRAGSVTLRDPIWGALLNSPPKSPGCSMDFQIRSKNMPHPSNQELTTGDNRHATGHESGVAGHRPLATGHSFAL